MAEPFFVGTEMMCLSFRARSVRTAVIVTKFKLDCFVAVSAVSLTGESAVERSGLLLIAASTEECTFYMAVTERSCSCKNRAVL